MGRHHRGQHHGADSSARSGLSAATQLPRKAPSSAPATCCSLIDPRPYQAALDQAKGDLGRAEAIRTKTEQDVTRYTPLAAEKAIAQEELDNAIQANRAAKAAVDSARAAVEKAQLNLDWTQIKSPIDGIAGIAVAQIGDLVSENTLLTTVSQVDPIKVSFPISEQEYLKFARPHPTSASAQKTQRTLELILADGSVYPERGRASVANREVDVKTGTMMIVSPLPEPAQPRCGPASTRRCARPPRRGKAPCSCRSAPCRSSRAAYQVAVVGADNKVAMRTVKAGAAHRRSLGHRRRPQARRTSRRRGPAEGARRRHRQPEAGRASGERKGGAGDEQ